MGRDDDRDDFLSGERLTGRDLHAESEYLRARDDLIRRELLGNGSIAREPRRIPVPVVSPDDQVAHPIEAVPTTLTAFVGVVDGDREPGQVGNWREFADAWPAGTAMSDAVEAYFRCGGQDAWLCPLADLTPEEVSRAVSALPADVSLVAVVADPAPRTDLIAAAAAALIGRPAVLLVEGPWTDAATAVAAMSSDPAAAVGASGPDVAVYWPRVRMLSASGTPRLISPLGAVAGAIVASDLTAGVFRTPAGSRAALDGIEAPAVALTSGQSEALSPLGVNVIRFFAGHGTVVWGARTRAELLEWRYLSVRRGSHLVAESIRRGLAWAVFEPNDESLWTQVRRDVSAFLIGLWRDGALYGQKPEDAFFVRCDRTTMTEADIDEGRLICDVGIAPIKPAEFVVLRIVVPAESAP